jgi:hypothetical protein
MSRVRAARAIKRQWPREGGMRLIGRMGHMQSDIATEVPAAATGKSPALADRNVCPTRERLPVQTVERLHRLLGGEPFSEGIVLRFIRERWGARSLIYLPPAEAARALANPTGFLSEAKAHCEMEVGF